MEAQVPKPFSLDASCPTLFCINLMDWIIPPKHFRNCSGRTNISYHVATYPKGRPKDVGASCEPIVFAKRLDLGGFSVSNTVCEGNSNCNSHFEPFRIAQKTKKKQWVGRVRPDIEAKELLCTIPGCGIVFGLQELLTGRLIGVPFWTQDPFNHAMNSGISTCKIFHIYTPHFTSHIRAGSWLLCPGLWLKCLATGAKCMIFSLACNARDTSDVKSNREPVKS